MASKVYCRLQVALVVAILMPQAVRSSAVCKPHDASDTFISQCQSWCNDPSHCSFCKCAGCSMCKTCAPSRDDDSSFETCEPWCVGGEEHCSLCKCKACESCRGHHPETSCNPFDADDTDHHTCHTFCASSGEPACNYCSMRTLPRLALLSCILVSGALSHRSLTSWPYSLSPPPPSTLRI